MPGENVSKRALRLKAAGLWEAFKLRRKCYLAQGMTPLEADELVDREYAHVQKIEAAGDAPAESEKKIMGSFRKSPKKTTSFAADVRFVYDHLIVLSTTEHAAPSTGAWALLLAARTDPDLRMMIFKFAMAEAAKQPNKPAGETGKPEVEQSDDDRNLDSLLEEHRNPQVV